MHLSVLQLISVVSQRPNLDECVKKRFQSALSTLMTLWLPRVLSCWMGSIVRGEKGARARAAAPGEGGGFRCVWVAVGSCPNAFSTLL